MWGWVGELVTALLKFFERMVSKETYAKQADPTANGTRERFAQRVREFRAARAIGDARTTSGTCDGKSVCSSEGRNKDQVG
jgi:hypothetical protein